MAGFPSATAIGFPFGFIGSIGTDFTRSNGVYDHLLGRNRWLRDCAYGQTDPGNERSYGEEAEVHVLLSPYDKFILK